MRFELGGPEGSPYFLMAQARLMCRQLNRLEDWPPIMEKMMGGTYQHLLETLKASFPEVEIEFTLNGESVEPSNLNQTSVRRSA